MIRATAYLAILALALASTSGCRTNEPLTVSTIQLGRSLNPDNTVANHTTRFKRDDTIYAAILTDGPGSATISVRWKYAGRVIGEPTKNVSYRGPAATEFHIQNSGGFPPGDYSVEIFLNGQQVGTRDFRVEK